MMHWLARQRFKGRAQKISCFLPGALQFAEFFGPRLGVRYVNGRITGRTIHDCHPGRETLERSVKLRGSLLFYSRGLPVRGFALS
jgi:hypothetical protein